MEKTENIGRNEVLCRVCGDKASGKHYGVASCDGCRGFFKRSIRRNLDYVCKESNACIVDVTRRNQCQACRFKKCLQVNMKRDAVQHERAPRTASSSSKPKYVPCYPYYFPFKPTLYSSPFLGSSSNLMSAAAAAAAAASNIPFELSTKFDFIPPPSGPHPPVSGASLGQMIPSMMSLSTQRRLLAHHPNSSIRAGESHAEETVSASGFPIMMTTARNGAMTTMSSGGIDGPRIDSRSGSANGLRMSSVKLENGMRSSPSSDSSGGGVKEDEVSSSGADMSVQNPSVFKLDLNLLSVGNDNVYESAAKLLFLSVKWARSVPSFLHLPFGDQSLLLEEAWPELFILSAAQWSLPIDEGLLLTGSLVPRNQQETLITELRFLKDALSQISNVRPDHTELACLKALVLFKPEILSLRESMQIEILQDQTHLMLQDYCLTKQPPNKIRFGKLLLVLPNIRRVSRRTLEELFFKQTVGDVPIQRLLCDMFKAQ